MARPVDAAMGEDRPPKRTIRRLWLQAVREREANYSANSGPLYLTLTGAEGRDIDLMLENGLLRTSEVGAVVAEDQEKMAAVEASPGAVLALQRRFPGLKILEVPVENLVRSTNPTRWPQGNDERYCRAHVINLDLNEPLLSQDEQGHVVFPILLVVSKLAQIHARPPRREWALCLTLHGQITLEARVQRILQRILAENFVLEPAYAAPCRRLLGNDLYERILATQDVPLSDLSPEEQQALLMTLVPKQIGQLVVDQGWRTETVRNLRYGGGLHAPMVTWIINFVDDPRARTTRNTVYRESLRALFVGCAQIEEDGDMSPLLP